MTTMLQKIRHSLAHILAQAVQRSRDPEVKLWVGPAIDNGFYYDFLFSDQVPSDTDLKQIQKTMENILKEKQPFKLFKTQPQTAQKINQYLDQPFKNELLQKFQDQWETNITFYANTIPQKLAQNLQKQHPQWFEKYQNITQFVRELIQSWELQGQLDQDEFITFFDMCEGPHVPNTADIQKWTFKLAKVAGAYWLGDEKNPMMTRIYGYAFETPEQLQDYLHMLQEAKKRDHRILGEKLKLFRISPDVWAGLPLLHPAWTTIKNEVINYLWELNKKEGYERIWSPHITKWELYKISGHLDKYGENIFKVSAWENEFYLKPMNCPHHIQLYKDNQFSYRDLPIRYFEPATVYRNEKSWELLGLTRVISLTQDDGHVFARPDQLKEEIWKIVKIITTFYKTLGLLDQYRVSLSLRWDDKDKYLGDDQLWDQAENSLKELAQEFNLNYKEVPGEAAFYGPKLDFMFKDAIGREWQLSTIQVDFNLPQRFEIFYIDQNGEKQTPVMIHRAISWSLERFMGVLIEHFAGVFPLWLAPRQVRIVPVGESHIPYAQELRQKLFEKDIRVDVDTSDASLNKKIRNAEKLHINYIVVVGDKEMQDQSVAVRSYRTKKITQLKVNEFLETLLKEIQTKSLDPLL